MFFKTLFEAFKVKRLRHRLYLTLFIIAVFRIGAQITTPGINASALSAVSRLGFLNQLSLISGNALKQFSLFALGISPYISASILIQSLQMDVMKPFSEWANQGEVGRQKLNKATRWLTLVLAIIQGYGVLLSIHGTTGGGILRADTLPVKLVVVLAIVTGSLVVTWLSEMITDKGIGNGQSMIIVAGILSGIPEFITGVYRQLFTGTLLESVIIQRTWLVVGFAIGILVLIYLTTYVQQAEYRIPVQYLNRVHEYGSKSYMPLKLNPAGVIPVIFASVLMTLPSFIQSVGQVKAKWFLELVTYFDMTRFRGMLIYVVMIILFTFMYNFVQVNPEKTAKNFTNGGSYLIGVRPGLETENFIASLLYRLSLIGGLFLAFICVAPLIFTKFSSVSADFALTGTSLLIVITGAIDIVNQLGGFVKKKQYRDLY